MPETRTAPKTGRGRKPGQTNRFTKDVKARILAALDMVGGEKYLARQAEKNPAAFMALLAKVMPMQVKAEVTDFTYVIQKIAMPDDPVPGVINMGIPCRPRLVANGSNQDADA